MRLLRFGERDDYGREPRPITPPKRPLEGAPIARFIRRPLRGGRRTVTAGVPRTVRLGFIDAGRGPANPRGAAIGPLSRPRRWFPTHPRRVRQGVSPVAPRRRAGARI